MMRLTILATLSCLLIILLTNTVQVQSTPVMYSKWDEYIRMSKDDEFQFSKDNQCRHGGEVKNLCEKCAKVTKNEVVFPLCCQGKKGVATWCQKFLDYRPAEPVFSV